MANEVANHHQATRSSARSLVHVSAAGHLGTLLSLPYEEPGKSLRCRLAPWLRAIVALDNDEVGDQMPVSNLLVGLILRRVIARQRRVWLFFG